MSAFKATTPALNALKGAVRPLNAAPLARRAALQPALHGRVDITRPFARTLVSRSNFAKNPVISYDELKPITEQPNDNILLVDVREREENALGSIPSAVNLPLSELRDALAEGFNAGEFQNRYAFPKPVPTQNMIFFCRSGKRSATAAEAAGEKGYHNIRNYTGSWLEWSSKENGKEDDD